MGRLKLKGDFTPQWFAGLNFEKGTGFGVKKAMSKAGPFASLPLFCFCDGLVHSFLVVGVDVGRPFVRSTLPFEGPPFAHSLCFLTAAQHSLDK